MKINSKGEQKKPRSIWFAVGGALLGIGAILGVLGFVTTAIQKVRTGHGLDTYRTAARLVEFNWISVLVVLVVILLVFAIAVVDNIHSYLQWRAFEKKYGHKDRA